jgi:hypothetical protein
MSQYFAIHCQALKRRKYKATTIITKKSQIESARTQPDDCWPSEKYDRSRSTAAALALRFLKALFHISPPEPQRGRRAFVSLRFFTREDQCSESLRSLFGSRPSDLTLSTQDWASILTSDAQEAIAKERKLWYNQI